MKIVISTKVLVRIAHKAIQNVSSSFTVSGKDSMINFEGIESGVVAFIEAREYEQYEGRFVPQQWSNVVDFVKQLPEQPIVIYFIREKLSGMHERPEFVLMQFEKPFKS